MWRPRIQIVMARNDSGDDERRPEDERMRGTAGDDDDDDEEEEEEEEEDGGDDDDEQWEPEHADDVSDEELREYILSRSHARGDNNANAQSLLPADVLSTVQRVFGDQPFMPMRFVRTDRERQQQSDVLNERIAQQLRGYESSECSDPLAARRKSTRSRHVFHALCQREQSGRNSKAQMVHLQETFMPFQQHKHCKVVDNLGERLYCGDFNSTGTRFLVAGQLAQILLYDTTDWHRRAYLPAREVQWTVTDAKFMPDDRNVIYSSITSNVRMVSVDYESTQREEVFSLTSNRNRPDERRHALHRSRFGVWSIDINASGTEFVAGTGSNAVVLYDMQTRTTLCHAQGHQDDVNAVAFVDGPLHSNVFVSGSDDCMIKLWDRRVLSESDPQPQGVFPGHIDGVTYIASRDDGYYFISNAKDQTCKLWDIRECCSAADYERLPRFRKPYMWDYRFQDFPGLHRPPVDHPNDRSVMTYRGHLVAETLIRCHFSPLDTTGQKYIFSGSADGRVYVYHTLTGDLVEIFAMKRDGLTRDVRWHPFEPTIVSPDFYGKLCVWQRQD
ncbi:hypothetical protein PINS_up005023 [Pythium insidiosum]|nr:hypothetical protein PINS_up005023 [Pythium insidiosum]